MYTIARSVYQHRWALVIAWGVITLFFTPPALYLVLRKTAAWPQEKDSTWYEPNKWMVASSRNVSCWAIWLMNFAPNMCIYIIIDIYKILICMAEIPVVPVILFYEKVSALEKTLGILGSWAEVSWDWGCFSYYLQAFLIHPFQRNVTIINQGLDKSLFICPWLEMG